MSIPMRLAASDARPAESAPFEAPGAVAPEPPRDALEGTFRALAHGTRIQILLLLRDSPAGLCAGEIATSLPCTWPTASRHLRILEDAGLVKVRAQGRERIYQVCQARLRSHLDDWFAQFFGSEVS